MNIQSNAPTAPTTSPTDLSGAAQSWLGQMGDTANKVQSAKAETNSIDELLMKLALSGADAKTLILARQILECDQMISENLEEIQQLNKLRQQHAARKQELVAFKAFVNKHAKDGKLGKAELEKHWPEFVAQNPGIVDKYDLKPTTVDWDAKKPQAPTGWMHQSQFNSSVTQTHKAFEWATYRKELEEWKRARAEDIGNLGTEFLAKQSFTAEGDGIETSYSGSIFGGESITVDEVEAAMLSHDNAIQKLDQAKELINIRNQQALQRKQRTLTLVSNFNQAEHEGRKAVISNTRA